MDQITKLSRAPETRDFSYALEAGSVAVLRRLDQQPRRKRMGLPSFARIIHHPVAVYQFDSQDFGFGTHGSWPDCLLDTVRSCTLQYSQVSYVLEGLTGKTHDTECCQ